MAAARSCSQSTNWSMPSGSVTASCCSRKAAFAGPAPSTISARAPARRRRDWRMCSLRSPDPLTPRRAPIAPLLAKELRGVLSGRALWTMLLILCPLAGYSFFQAVSLYGEASAAARASPILATGLSPLDGVLVPTFGAFYVTVTLLFPFVAIRVLGREKETGALRMLVQMPYRPSTLIIAKVAAIVAAWWLASIPALCSLLTWKASGGHLGG